jgi:hypothetical protein
VKRCVGRALIFTAACAPSLGGQAAHHPAPSPDAQECRVLANKLASDPHSAAFREALRSNIAACGQSGAAAIATAMRAAKGVQDANLADSFRFPAAYTRNAQLLETALDVAADRSASVPMRILAMEAALRQHRISEALGDRISDLTARPMGRICRITFVEHAGEYKSAGELPVGYEQSIVSQMRQIAADEGSPRTVRDVAQGVADRIERKPDVDLQAGLGHSGRGSEIRSKAGGGNQVRRVSGGLSSRTR